MWIVFAIISCILGTLMQLLNKKVLLHIDSLIITFIKNGFVFLFSFWIIISSKIRAKIANLDKKVLFMIIILSIVTFLTYLFFYFALKYGELNKVLAIDRFSIVLVFSYLLFTRNENLNSWNFLGAILIFMGIILVMFKS